MAKSSLSAGQLIFTFLFRATLNLEHRNLTWVKNYCANPKVAGERLSLQPHMGLTPESQTNSTGTVFLFKSQTHFQEWKLWILARLSKALLFILYHSLKQMLSFTKMRVCHLIQLLPILLQCHCSLAAEKHLRSQVWKADVSLHLNYFAWNIPGS